MSFTFDTYKTFDENIILIPKIGVEWFFSK